MDSDLEEIRGLQLERKVYRLRHRDGLSWHDVASKVSKQFDKNISSKKVQDIYDNYIARANVIMNTKGDAKRGAKDVNEQWIKEMQDLLQKIKEKSLKHLEIADKLLIHQYEDGNVNAYFKNLPVAISLFRSLLDQAGFLGKRLEKIEINQKNFILNETQILQLVNKRMSQREESQGYKTHPLTGEIIFSKKKKVFI